MNFNKIKEKIIIIIIICIFMKYIYNINYWNSIYITIKNLFKFHKGKERVFDSNFEYHKYQRELITEKIKKYSKVEQIGNEPYFLNGIIRKFKPKKCLEIGVSKGGSSVIILNAIKDINIILF